MSDYENSYYTVRNLKRPLMSQVPAQVPAQVSAQVEVVDNTVTTVTKTPKVAKKKSLNVHEKCSIGGNGISIVTQSLTTEGKAKPQDIIVIEGIEDEMDIIDKYIEENAKTIDTMRGIDSELTNKLVRQLVRALFDQHYEEGVKAATGNKKYNLVQDVLNGSAELNKALSGLAKYDADQEFLLNNIDREAVNEFVKTHKDLVDSIGSDSHDDLYIKSKILEAIGFFVKKPIADVLFDAKMGNDAIIKAHPTYIPFIKKDAPKDDKDFVQMDKNCANLNAEYSLAYITLAQMITFFDEYIVKQLTKKRKDYHADYIKTNLPEEVTKDTEMLLDLVDDIKHVHGGKIDYDALDVKIRLYTILMDQESLKNLAPLDKKLAEKLNNEKSKWPCKINTKSFEREYTSWMLKQDEEYCTMVYELQVATKALSMSKRFIIDGCASDITKKEDCVDKIIYTIQEKFENYRIFLSTELADQKQGTYSTFCGRTVSQGKSTKRGVYDKINVLTDVQLLLCTKHVAEVEAEAAAKKEEDEAAGIEVEQEAAEDDSDDDSEAPEVADSAVPKGRKIEPTKAIPSYGTYIRKLYKNAIKPHKYTFSVTDESFVNMICHIVRDTVNMYTCLAIDSYNNFIESKLYTTRFEPFADGYRDLSIEEADDFVKQMSLYIAEKAGLEHLPSDIPMLMDLFEAFNENMRTAVIPHPSSFYNISCPIASANINKYKVDISHRYEMEEARYQTDIEEAAAEDNEEQEGDETAAKKKAKKVQNIQAFDKMFRNYYKSSTPKPKNKHTTNFLNDLSMVVNYIVSLRLTWLGKLITFSSNEGDKPYYSVDDRKHYAAVIVQKFVDSVGASASSNKAFGESIFKHLKEIRGKLDKNSADIEELIRADMDKLRAHSHKALLDNEALKENKLNKIKRGTTVAPGKNAPITSQEKKIVASHSFASNFVMDRIRTFPIESKNIPFFNKKIERLCGYAEELACENICEFEINKEEHTQLVWSYPVRPYTNNASIGIIGSTLQRSLLSVVENALTTQFHATGPKKNVVQSDTLSSVLNMMGANEIW